MLVTLAAYWIAASYVIGIGLAVDQLRRPLRTWEQAGRNRKFWVALSLAMGFHGLGEYAAAAYFAGVVPRFRAAERAGLRLSLQQGSAAAMSRWQRFASSLPSAREYSAEQELALLAALLVFVSSFIHSAEISGHFEQYWLYGVFFGVVTLLQAMWSVLIYGDPLNRRYLIAGAVGNMALVVIWAITRTIGVPIGPQSGPEAVGVTDVLSKLDELAAVGCIAMVLVHLRGSRPSISGLQLRIAAFVSGPLFLYSVLAAFGGGAHHH